MNLSIERCHRKPLTSIFLFSVSCLCALFSVSPSFAQDEQFPERGNRADWSQAIPYYNLGNKYLEHQRYQEAATNFEDAVAIYPYDADFHVNLGVAYRKLEDYASAERAFRRASELNAKDWMTWSNLANAYLKQNKYKETKTAFERTLTCNPPSSERTAIQKDLMDLQKIITMQELNAKAAAGAKKNAQATRSPVLKAGEKKMISAAGSREPVINSQTPLIAPTSKQQLKDSGWDYSY